jgi:hypothetical protein
MRTHFAEVLARESTCLAGVTDGAKLAGWRRRVVEELMTPRSPYALALRQIGMSLRTVATKTRRWRADRFSSTAEETAAANSRTLCLVLGAGVESRGDLGPILLLVEDLVATPEVTVHLGGHVEDHELARPRGEPCLTVKSVQTLGDGHQRVSDGLGAMSSSSGPFSLRSRARRRVSDFAIRSSRGTTRCMPSFSVGPQRRYPVPTGGSLARSPRRPLQPLSSEQHKPVYLLVRSLPTPCLRATMDRMIRSIQVAYPHSSEKVPWTSSANMWARRVPPRLLGSQR